MNLTEAKKQSRLNEWSLMVKACRETGKTSVRHITFT